MPGTEMEPPGSRVLSPPAPEPRFHPQPGADPRPRSRLHPPLRALQDRREPERPSRGPRLGLLPGRGGTHHPHPGRVHPLSVRLGISHEAARPMLGDYHPLLLHDPDGAPNRRPGHLVASHKLALRRERHPRGQPPLLDVPPQDVGQLLVQRHRALTVQGWSHDRYRLPGTDQHCHRADTVQDPCGIPTKTVRLQCGPSPTLQRPAEGIATFVSNPVQVGCPFWVQSAGESG